VHPTALVESQEVGEGTRVWAFTHVMKEASVGHNCNIGEHCFVESGADIGNDVTLKNGNEVWDGVTLSDGVFVGPKVCFTNDLRPRSPRLAQAAGRYASHSWLTPTLVGRGASLGAGCIILAGNTVGEFAMVASGAIVTHDVPAYALFIGAPARLAGWACQCGASLEFRGGAAACEVCGMGFVRGEGIVRPAHPEDQVD
jgi:acetyltransferase-like isoleucine patch superfamily enzyme